MSKILKILTTECMIIQYQANQHVMRIPFVGQAQKWKAIQKNGYILIGPQSMKSKEIQCKSLTNTLKRKE